MNASASDRTNVDWPAFAELIQASQRIAVTTHHRPDCDALGSQLAMHAILAKLGKDVRCVNGFHVPERYHFLDTGARWEYVGDTDPQWLAGIDMLLVVDTSAWAQLGEMGDFIRGTSAKIVVLDHHVNGDDLGAIEFRDSTAEAAGRLVADAAEVLGVELDADMATSLYAAVATDTGWFRFPSVKGRTYRLAAQLVEAGAVPHEIYCELYEQETLARLNLVGRILARATAEREGRLVHTHITLDDFEQTNAKPTDSEDVINQTLTVAGTEFAVIFVEQQGGGFKMSFRSRCPVDCSELARQFGGGGHKAAAGAFVDEPLDTLQQRVLDATRSAMDAVGR